MFYVRFNIVRIDAFVDLFYGCDCFSSVDTLFVMLRLARWPPIWDIADQMAAVLVSLIRKLKRSVLKGT